MYCIDRPDLRPIVAVPRLQLISLMRGSWLATTSQLQNLTKIKAAIRATGHIVLKDNIHKVPTVYIMLLGK
jgi:hypothetical protein